MAERDNELYEHEPKPDIDFLKSDFERTRHNLSYVLDLAEEARDIRRNVWAGKSKTARKEDPDSFPFQGASDLESNLVSPLIDGDIALLKSAVTRGNLIASPVESNDISTASIVTQFMRWRLSTMEELPREVGVAANYLLEQGFCFIGISFRREVTRELKPITLQEITALSPDIGSAITDDDLREGVLDLFQSAFPNLSKKRINTMYRELRSKGETEIPQEKVVTNRPTIRAYELGRDLIVDSNIHDLQSARAVYTVNYYTPEQLTEKVKTEGFDADFVEEVIESTTGDFDHKYGGYSEAVMSGQQEAPEHYDGLVRLISCYRKEITEEGIPVCTYTCFSEQVEGYAKTYTMSVDSGKYPFVAITREHLSRRLLDSRGYPEMLRSYQIAVKSEMDSRRDRASLSTCPPVEYRIGTRPERIGAGSQIPVRRRGDIGYMEIPPQSQASTEVEMQIRQLADKLTGRATSQADAVEANLIRQSLVNNFLHGFSQVLNKMWAMDRTYNSSIWFRVTANARGQSIIMDEMASVYDFALTFNSMNNDEEKVVKKLEMIGKIMGQFDRSGVSRFDQYLRVFIDAIDPNLSDQLLMPQQEASTKEIIETSNDIAKISSGQVVNAPTSGINPALRLQVIQQFLAGTEDIGGEDNQARLQQDEKFRARLEKYSNQLTFQIQQAENAKIGAIGTTPGNIPASVAV
ncbi:putative head-tail connector protein [uncultured Mediterranean phage uvMED]|nr:putative head-tail connector protein [uncultured Mediterranean phage uvMED]